MDFEQLPRKTATKSMVLSLALHGLFFCSVLVLSVASSKTLPPPHRLLVQSIALHPQKATTTQIASLPPPEPKIEKEEPPPQQEEKAPLPEEKKEPEGDPQEEKQPPQETKTVSKKTPEKTEVQKPQKAKAPVKKGTPKKPSQPTKSPAKKPKESKPTYDQKLIAEALKRLDKSRSNSSSSPAGSKTTSSKRVGSVGSLNVESGVSSPSFSEESPYDGYQEASPEAHYIADLIRRLQLNVRLPEPGEVRVKLTLNRSGVVTSVKVVSGKTEKVKQAIAEKLRSITFSSFGRSFSGETDHSFLLRLSNDLLWSCG